MCTCNVLFTKQVTRMGNIIAALKLWALKATETGYVCIVNMKRHFLIKKAFKDA